MPCYHPLQAWRSKHPNKNGKMPLVFSKAQAAQPDTPIEVPCGRCIGCRLERSRQWAIRIMHEAKLHKENSFLTLTYNDEKIPSNHSLHHEDIVLFLKRYRKLLETEDKKIRYFNAGEYGEKNFRPHYHMCLFGHEFKDKQVCDERNGQLYYKSQTLNKLWGKGDCIIGELTFESAAYVARYITKKVTGDQAEKHYERVFEATGEVVKVEPEYCTMSRGIGIEYAKKYIDDIYPNDVMIVNGRQLRPPRAYDKLCKEIKPFDHDIVKERRIEKARTSVEAEAHRLYTKEKIQLAKYKNSRGKL